MSHHRRNSLFTVVLGHESCFRTLNTWKRDENGRHKPNLRVAMVTNLRWLTFARGWCWGKTVEKRKQEKKSVTKGERRGRNKGDGEIEGNVKKLLYSPNRKFSTTHRSRILCQPPWMEFRKKKKNNNCFWNNIASDIKQGNERYECGNWKWQGGYTGNENNERTKATNGIYEK